MNFKREVILSENIIEKENGRMYYFIVVKSYKKLFTYIHSWRNPNISIFSLVPTIISLVRIPNTEYCNKYYY